MYHYVPLSLKNILIALAILLSTNLMFAQPVPMEQSAIDSLTNIINGNTPDTAKVHALYWLSRSKTLSTPVNLLR